MEHALGNADLRQGKPSGRQQGHPAGSAQLEAAENADGINITDLFSNFGHKKYSLSNQVNLKREVPFDNIVIIIIIRKTAHLPHGVPGHSLSADR